MCRIWQLFCHSLHNSKEMYLKYINFLKIVCYWKASSRNFMCVGLKNCKSFFPNKGEKMSHKDICVKQPFI